MEKRPAGQMRVSETQTRVLREVGPPAMMYCSVLCAAHPPSARAIAAVV